jgi:hypothetical protein
MDCNSILYDVFHAWTKQGSESSIEKSEDQIIGRVIEKIQFYVRLVQPQHLVYVAFDGVAPRAKMNQQRQRRYKSEYMKQIQGQHEMSEPGLSTTMFTPGTRFMQKLTVQLKRTLASLHRYIVSASDEPGEGEHKITQHMRDTADASHVVAWYGLDSDLIMLSILHCRRFHHVYLFRETPAKPPSHGKTQSPVEEEILYMNIPLLVRSIYIEIMQKEPEELGADEMWRRVYDYVFLCFFLGNDFLPHFPALNLRTHGIQVLVDTYRAHVVPEAYTSFPASSPKGTGLRPSSLGSTRRFLVDVTAGAIQWKQVYVLVSALARIEPILWNKEYEHREKLAKRTQMDVSRSSNLADPNSFERMPVLFRGKELYISPRDAGWESRYYRALFPDDESLGGSEAVAKASNAGEPTKEVRRSFGLLTDRREVSCNYLEALEWVFTYYVSGCSHWHWHYRYEYPPLLSDLVRYVPHFDTRFLPIPTVLDTTPATCTEQLYIVLPPSQHHLILDHAKSECPLDETPIRATEFEWSFCTYFWESHLVHN